MSVNSGLSFVYI